MYVPRVSDLSLASHALLIGAYRPVAVDEVRHNAPSPASDRRTAVISSARGHGQHGPVPGRAHLPARSVVVLPASLSLALARRLYAGRSLADMHGTSGVAPSDASSMDVSSPPKGRRSPRWRPASAALSLSPPPRRRLAPGTRPAVCARKKGGRAVVPRRMDPVVCQDCPPVLADRAPSAVTTSKPIVSQ
jgi:hypothetical protein